MHVATSMRQALLMRTAAVHVLDLTKSTDVVCVNMMCDKLEGPCVCRVARFIEQNNWDCLQELRLANNKLDQIPPSIFLSTLKYLDLSDNQLSNFPPEVKRCQNLESLNLANNRIVEVSWDALKTLPKLRTIDLRGNDRLVVPPQAELLAMQHVRMASDLPLSDEKLAEALEETKS